MQTIRLLKLLVTGVVILLFASCSKNNTQGKLIPKEAAIVIRLDGKSLSSKLPWDEIKQNPLFTEMNADSSLPETLKSLLDNPDNAGIDTKTDLMLFAIKDSLGGYIAFEGNVKDESTFKSFNQKITGNGAESEKEGVQYISKSPVCVGWTKEKFVYIFDSPEMSKADELTKRMIRDSIDVSPRSKRDIGSTCKAIFALKENNSLGSDKKFTKLMTETGDVHLWMNSEELSKGGSASNALAMVNLDKFFKGNITTATLNFENGKITANAKTYASEEMIKLFKKYSGGKINEDMIKRMPGKDVVGVMALNFKPEAIRELIKMTGLDGLVNLGIEKFGFSMDDFIKANKGDIFLGVSDLVLNKDSTSLKFNEQEENIAFNQKPTFNFIFSASIGDKESFNKLINAGKKLGQRSGGDSTKVPVSFNSNSSFFVLSNKKENVDQYLAAATNNLEFISKIGGEPFGGYLNLQTLLKSINSQSIADSSAKIAYQASLKMWDNVIWKGGKYNDDGILQTMELNLVDKTTNSLKQLNQYMATFNELYKDQKRKKKEEIMAYQDFESAEGLQPPPPPSATIK